MSGKGIVYIVDDDETVRASTSFFLKVAGFEPRCHASGQAFCDAAQMLPPGCILLDMRMPRFDGFDVLTALGTHSFAMPVIVMTGHGDVATAVKAMKLGAMDFIEKPFEEDFLLERLAVAFAALDAGINERQQQEDARARLGRLTPREDDVLRGLIAGRPNKVLAFELGLSVRTVEMHRANMMDRLGVRTLPDAFRIALRAGTIQFPPVVQAMEALH